MPIICMVRFPTGSKDYCYIADDDSIHEGDLVLAFTRLSEDQPCIGAVTQKHKCPPYEPPCPIEKIRHILGKFSFDALQDYLSADGIAVDSEGVACKYDYQTVGSFVTFPQGTKAIGRYLFSTGSLHLAVIPEGVERIETGAFVGAVEMVAVSIPSTVREIAEDAFAQCLGVREFYVSPDNKYYKKVGPYIISDQGTTLFRVWDKGEKTFSIPEGIKVINHSAFDYCKVEKLVIPMGVERIGTDAFQQCYQLKTIEFPESLLEIQDDAFKLCKRLEQVVIPKGVKWIGAGAFNKCDGLQFVLVEGSRTEVSNSVFALASLGGLENDPVPLLAPHILPNCFGIKLRGNILLGFVEMKRRGVKMDQDVEQAYLEMIRTGVKNVPPIIEQSPERLNIWKEVVGSKSKITPAIKGNVSNEMAQLITFIKENRLEKDYLLALNYEGILFLVNPDHKPDEDWCESYDFGFDCAKDHGFFYLCQQVPDENPVGVLMENGIPIAKLETLADIFDQSSENEDCEDV